MSTNDDLIYRDKNHMDMLINQYYDRGILKKEIRSYEVSLWTLQDEFITVLKWSDVEQKGRIENPKLKLNIDGTEEFTFSIPAYYRVEGKLVENPNWYNTQNGNLIEGLRKVKVIFNKGTTDEEVFELLITKVTDEHEGDIATCEVSAQGLPFQELGKIGYKLQLSQDNFEEHYKEWQTKGYWTNRKNQQIISENPPIQNLNYWCEEGCHLELYPQNGDIESHKWYYTVQMNYKSFEDGSTNQRSSGVIYEETYPSAWDPTNLKATQFVSYQEKARPMSCENSNLYNITQDLAKTFGVFCKYKYLHDDNYHITGKIIIFYNNFSSEEEGSLSFTYPYSASRTEREIDSESVTTKLYVLNVDNDSILNGYNSIMYAPPNASKEDYILNFDYLKKIGTISDEQYAAIDPYLIQMRGFNDTLEVAQQCLSTYQTQLPELEGQRAIYEKAITLDQEQITQNNLLRNELDSLDGTNDGYITLTNANCDQAVVLKNDIGKKYVNLKTTNKGIVENTVRIWTTWTGTTNTLSGEITGFGFEHDEYNNPTSIYFTQAISNSQNRVYLTYSYDPRLYYDNIVKTWEIKLAKDTEEYHALRYKIGPKSATESPYVMDDGTYSQGMTVAEAYEVGLYKKINDQEELIKSTLAAKAEVVEEFEYFMGPALREGYWSPEDYNDYGELLEAHSIINIPTNRDNITNDSGNSAIVYWDTKLFDDEDKLYYQVGVSGGYEYYPCIDLTAIPFEDNVIPDTLSSYSLVWKDNNIEEDTWNSPKDLRVFSVGSQLLVKILRINVEGETLYKPVLMVVGAKNLTGDQLERMISTGRARLEKYTTSVSMSGVITISHGLQSEVYTIPPAAWICYRYGNTKPIGMSQELWSTYINQTNFDSNSATRLAYPRIKFSSLALKTDTSNLNIKYGGTLLNQFNDYYINNRNTDRNGVYYLEYYITLKPESLIKCGYDPTKIVSTYYVLSNANTEIYLDALEISKENAYPKVSYNLTANILNTNLMHTLYNQLARIIMINDTDLKLENVFGYISGVDLDLDAPWNDTLEVKNYTSKFEDLFSSIVAQAEDMRRSEGTLNAVLAGSVPLSEEGLTSTLSQSTNVLQNYLDSYFDSSEVVKEKLTSLFNEAGEILSTANSSLNSLISLTSENASILNSFAQNVPAALAVHVYSGPDRPASFNSGDMWFKTCTDKDGNTYIKRMVAMSNSTDISGDREYENETSGFSATYDGSLASIIGAGMSYDAEDGTVDIYAQNDIDIRSGSGIQIRANDYVSILGNQAVNIGGSKINIAAAATKSFWQTGISMRAIGMSEGLSNVPVIPIWTEILDKRDLNIVDADDDILFKNAVLNHLINKNPSNTITLTKFIDPTASYTLTGRLVSDGAFDYDMIYQKLYETTTIKSSVDIFPTKISMAAAELELKAASTINILASQGNVANTSAISIDAEKGVWIGAGAGVRLFGSGHTLTETVYVGPIHKKAFRKGDYWIQTTTHSGDYFYDTDSQSFYTGYILDTYGHSTIEFFTIEHIWKATGNWFDYYGNEAVVPEGGTLGWTEQATADIRADAVSIIKNRGVMNGASIELNAEHVLLGYANAEKRTGTVIEMTEEYMVLAVGSQMPFHENNQTKSITGTTGSLIGAKFTATSIGFATQTSGQNPTINAILMDTHGITLGSGSIDVTAANMKNEQLNVNNGSYVRIAGDGIEIGSLADLYINTDNFKLQTHSRSSTGGMSYTSGQAAGGHTIMAVGTGLQYINNINSTIASIRALAEDTQTPIDVKLVLNQYGLYINGEVHATKLIAVSSRGYFKAEGTNFGLYETDGSAILTINNNAEMEVAKTFKLLSGSGIELSAATDIAITSPNFAVHSSPDSGGNYFYVGNSNATKYIRYTADGNLEIQGDITATSGTFTGTVNARILNVGEADSTAIMHYADGQLTIGSTASNSSSYLRYNSDGLTIKGALTATTLSVGSGTNLLTYNDGVLNVKGDIVANTLQVGSSNNLLTYIDGVLTVKGNVYANTGTFNGELTATKLTVGDNGSYLKYDSTNGLNIGNGKLTYNGGDLQVTGNGTFTGTINATGGTFSGNITASGTIQGGTLSGTNITANTLTLGSTSGSSYLTYDGTNGLIIKGAITATTLTLGSTSSSNYLIYDGSGLTVKGVITATSLYIIDGNQTTTAQDYINAKITPEKIWLGVTTATQNATLQLADGAITINGGTFTLDTTHLDIYSAGDANGYVINSHGNFIVDTGGNVYLNSLKVWNGSAYETVNISGNFSDAVSWSSGSWSGNKFTATLVLFNSSITKAVEMDTTITIDSVTVPVADVSWGWGTGQVSLKASIHGVGQNTSQIINLPGKAVDATAVANDALRLCNTAAINATKYTAPSATFDTVREMYLENYAVKVNTNHYTIRLSKGSLTGSGASRFRQYKVTVNNEDTSISDQCTDYGDGYAAGQDAVGLSLSGRQITINKSSASTKTYALSISPSEISGGERVLTVVANGSPLTETAYTCTDYGVGYTNGWNACLEQIGLENCYVYTGTVDTCGYDEELDSWFSVIRNYNRYTIPERRS